MNLYYDSYECILGKIYVAADERGINRIELTEEGWVDFLNNHTVNKGSDLCYEAIKQLDEYFNGIRKEFDLKLSIEGTEFRKKVWSALSNIPFGQTRSYSDLADAIGNPKAVRAVGQANRSNPIPIIIPCHRVIGKDKSLVGYAGTRTDIKEKLLKLEGAIL
jgi:methylated-DNA-[protein]-cysteine S-methyltransferase